VGCAAMLGAGKSPGGLGSVAPAVKLPPSATLERWSNGLVEILEAVVNHFSQPNDESLFDALAQPPGTPLEADVVAALSDSDKETGIIVAVIQWLQAYCVEEQVGTATMGH
jgi:hypothetical protein